MTPGNKLILIDGHSLAYRAFHALPPEMMTSRGELTNAVFGFASMLLTVWKEVRPDYIAVAFDMTEYGSFRYNLLDGSNDWFHGWPGDHCTECGKCLPRCPEELDIPRLLFDAHDLLKTASATRLWG